MTTPSSGADKGGVNRARFFTVEIAVAERALKESWSRDEILLYLLHCRGYNHTRRASLMGEQAALRRAGVTRLRWVAACAALESKGVVRSISPPGSKRPVTCIASADSPYGSNTPVDRGAAAIDGHRYRELADKPLLKLPWALFDQTEGAAPTLAHLRTSGSVLSLISLYGLSDDNGAVSNLLAWVEGEGETYRINLAEDVDDSLVVNAEGLKLESADLLASGLVFAGVEGESALTKGKWQVCLFHPLVPAAIAA